MGVVVGRMGDRAERLRDLVEGELLESGRFAAGEVRRFSSQPLTTRSCLEDRGEPPLDLEGGREDEGPSWVLTKRGLRLGKRFSVMAVQQGAGKVLQKEERELWKGFAERGQAVRSVLDRDLEFHPSQPGDHPVPRHCCDEISELWVWSQDLCHSSLLNGSVQVAIMACSKGAYTVTGELRLD
ncbi:hypothetical protein MLD38_006288 [Melastoma candidum]|uniref:Uncharacterized protein n=1 Tax=Melastoma candidum TaxID=119954 RepID=A0ACB9RR42_9MYRT|nr:hypothetical protein MLD38_006288 [Melastoma candidum]